MTAGVAVMPSAQAVSHALGRLQAAPAGLEPLPFSGTVTGKFHAAQRADTGAQAAGPYLLVSAAGDTDGEPGRVARANPELDPFASGVLTAVGDVLASHGSPCQLKDISC